MQLPPLVEMLRPFVSPKLGTAAAEIRLRAEHLADHQNMILASAREVWGHGSALKSPLRVGGTESGEVRGSGEGRRSFIIEAEERVRRSIGDVVAKAKRSGKSIGDTSRENKGSRGGDPTCTEEITDLIPPRVAYLLISPLRGVVSHLATMSLMPTHLPSLPKFRLPFQQKKEQDRSNDLRPSLDHAPDPTGVDSEAESLAELKLVRNPTLAAFGDHDVFVSSHKLRAWTKRMQEVQGSRFQAVEVSSAGHFWIEEKVLGKLIGLVAGFSAGLVEEGEVWTGVEAEARQRATG